MPKQPIASLTASLLTPAAASAGQGSPAVQTTPAPPAPAAPPAPVEQKPSGGDRGGGGAGKSGRPVAQTVKLEHRLFVRLKSHSANRRMSHQAIFVDALEEYLERHGG